MTSPSRDELIGTIVDASKQVTFGDVTISEHPIIMGDNPACTGCPITIDWKTMGTETHSLELYEYAKAMRDHSNGRKRAKELIIPVWQRSQLLMDAGYSSYQIYKRALEVAEIKDKREESFLKSKQRGLGKFSKIFFKPPSGFGNLRVGAIGPKPSKTTVVARMA